MRADEVPVVVRIARQRIARNCARIARAAYGLVESLMRVTAPLEPLFRGLRYGEMAFVYLLCGALTDQKILLHANDPALLLPAAQALRSLVAPLTFSSTYVPYLPTTLLHPSDAVTLINDSTSPYAARAIRAQFGAIL